MMMLRALAVGVDDSECLTLGFAEEADGSGPALLLQRVGDQYFLLTDTETTTLGGIDAWQLAEGWLKLKLSAAAAKQLGVHADVLIQFAPIHTDDVRSALARILR
jgi:hypothetical protein